MPANAMKKAPATNVLLGQLAYEAIREAMEKGSLKPGERVSEYKVAQWLKISRTPAREGLRRLESEGLLARHARRGLIVASLDDDAMHELYAAREVLEREAAAQAARRASDAEIETLKHLVDAEASIAEDPKRMYEHNLVFHQLIYRAAHNRYILKFLNAISDAISAHRSTSTLVQQSRRQGVIKEHRAIVAAIARRNEDEARNAAGAHIKSALKARTRLQHEAMIEAVQQRSRRHGRS
jgi:DNA-binding GntR family transcriptional regulator